MANVSRSSFPWRIDRRPRWVIGAAIRPLGEAVSGEQAPALAAEPEPDVVLRNLLLSDLDGIEVARRLLASGSPSRVLALTSAGDNRRVRDAIQAGVTGYSLKDLSKGDLLRAIEDAAAGRPALRPDVQRYLRHQASAPAQPSPLASLTKREREIMRFLALGYSNREIAGALELTYGAVKVYVSALLDKFGVSDRTQAALIAARYRLDAPEDAAPPWPSGH